jgi:molecular chaperone HtpG
MNTTPETLSFQAEVTELLDLMIHSLYSHREIFLRELVSNASDALDKLRVESLSDDELLGVDKRLCIRLEVEPAKRLVKIIDNGIGMSRDELVENLGTIARSGTRRYLEAMREQGAADTPTLIGQFGVGFYSSFMVADEITVETWRAGETAGTKWVSRGKGEYTLEEIEGGARGTCITLQLKSQDGDDPDWQDYSDANLLRALVKRYSDFVEYPIEMAAAHFPNLGDDEKETSEEGIEIVRLNSMKPLWARPKDEVTAEEHKEFYHHLTHAWDEPLETVHLKVEGTAEWTALLYVPTERPPELFDAQREKSRVSLYVKRVLIMHDCEELLPPWLRFVRGLVDSEDLPLNVSREILQQSRATLKIRERLVKKLLDSLAAMLAERREDYVRFWRAFGPVLKEGIVMDPEHAERVASLCLFESSAGEELTTLDEYVERMGEREEIWCLEARDRAAAETSPHLEAVRAKEQEALFLVDPVDEWVLERLREYKEKKLVSLEKGDVELGGESEKEQREQREREQRDLLDRLETELSEHVSGVRFSSRLVDSAAVLVAEEGAPGPYMERLMKQSGHDLPTRKRILELNPEHPVLERLKSLHDEDASSERVKEFADLLHGQALLAEGSPLPDPQRFGKLVSDLMVGR